MNPPEGATDTVRVAGRDFSAAELARIRVLTTTLPHRSAIAAALCAELGWSTPDGRSKNMSARVALLHMHRAGLITLPPPARANNNRCWPRHLAPTDEAAPLRADLPELGPLTIRLVGSPAQSRTWNTAVATHHYLGYTPLPGAQLRYLVSSERHGMLALAGFAAAAWACAPRDRFIGWDAPRRRERLALVVGNARFLVLPHVRVPNLASHLLGALTRRLPGDWQARYGYAPVLAETFVDANRFTGASYRAANWTWVGYTQGRGKLDRAHEHPLPVKEVYLHPLHRDYRRILTG